jgi:hypothetical protein
MGLATVLWDEDTNDWNMPGSGGGNLPPATVDGYFEDWIAARKNGSDNATGHVVLQHELNNATVSMAEKWLPQVQQAFNLVPWNQCFNLAQPYWETNFVYPVANGTTPNATVATTSNAVPVATSMAAVPTAAKALPSTNNPVNAASANAANKNLSVSGSAAISVFLGSMIAIAVYAV